MISLTAMTAANDNDPMIVRRHNANAWSTIWAFALMLLAAIIFGVLCGML